MFNSKKKKKKKESSTCINWFVVKVTQIRINFKMKLKRSDAYRIIAFLCFPITELAAAMQLRNGSRTRADIPLKM